MKRDENNEEVTVRVLIGVELTGAPAAMRERLARWQMRAMGFEFDPNRGVTESKLALLREMGFEVLVRDFALPDLAVVVEGDGEEFLSAPPGAAS